VLHQVVAKQPILCQVGRETLTQSINET